MDKIAIVIGKNIKKYRKLRGLTQRQLANKIGYSQSSTIAKIEKASINISNVKVEEIAKALNVSLSDLLEEKELPKDSYYVDTSMLTETQLTELNTIINMNVSMFNSSRELTDHDRKMVIKVLTEAFINSLPNKK